MARKYLLFLTILLVFTLALQAQNVDEIKAQITEKEAQIAALKGEVSGLQKELDNLPGWEFGSLGTIGLNFSQFQNWIATENVNTYSSTFGFAGSGFANLDQPGFFWRNSGAINIAKTKLDTDTEDDMEADYETSADAFGVSSLYGKKINEKFAISSLGEYRSTLLSNFNNPGYLDIGAGATWTPASNLVVVFHPLNYNFIFSKSDLNYISSLGCKIVADYSKSLPMGIAWKTNFSTFLSYKDMPNLSNWMWVNGVSFTVWKGLGAGFEFGLRGNKQESLNYNIKNFADMGYNSADEVNFDNLKENPVQTYWVLGFTYNL